MDQFEGTYMSAMAFPSIWLPQKHVTMLSLPAAQGKLQLFATDKGNFEVWYADDRGSQQLLNSARVKVTEGKHAIVALICANGTATLEIEMTRIPPAAESNQVIELRLIGEAEGTGELSFNSPLAASACQSWTEWRRKNLSSLDVP